MRQWLSAERDQNERLSRTLAERSLRHQRTWLFQAYMLMGALTFGVLAFFVSTTPYFSFDLAFTRALQAFNPPWFDTLMRLISQLGFDWKAIVVISLITLYLFAIGLRWEAAVGVIGSTGIWALDNIVKVLVHRPRQRPTWCTSSRGWMGRVSPAGTCPASSFSTASNGFWLTRCSNRRGSARSCLAHWAY